VYVGRAYNVLLTTDKPVYQPGQVIHLRGLALDTLDMHAAAGMTMTLSVADPQGNKLSRTEVAASGYGIASLDFALDTEAPSGEYAITAELGASSSTRSVEVKPYTLPRFEVTFAPEATFYLPGEMAAGVVEARYFFGKPLVGAEVVIEGTLDDGSGERTVVEISGATDAEGRYAYTFAVPQELQGQLDNKSIDIDLRISVTDTADHTETIDDSVTVAEKALLIEALPESGTLRRGIDDLVYLDVSYPDGVAAQAVLTVTDAFSTTFHAVTDSYGQAVITLTTPDDGLTPLVITAADARGNRVEQPLLLGGENGRSVASLLLRPERALYAVGDTLNVDILVGSAPDNPAGVVYLDIIKDRQSFGMAALPVSAAAVSEGGAGAGGIARAAIPIDGSLLGTLELNAYTVDEGGQIASDRRYVLVNPSPAEVAVSTDKAEYRPGETAVLDIQVTRNEEPLQAAVGVAIVDESVYAVEDADPSGFARTYFLLNRTLQKPRYGLHDFVDLGGDDPSPYDNLPKSIRYAEQSRQVALAGAFAEVLAAEARAQTEIGGDAAHPRGAQGFNPWELAAAWGNRLYLAAPLLGIALYDGSRSRRRLLVGLVVFSLGALVWGACAPAGAPAPAAEQAAADSAAEGSMTATGGARPPRLRQFFPETMYWLPELLTNAEGRAQIEAPVADSITTWRASLLVSDKEGNLGSAEIPLRVFQDFFVEPDLPRFLTVGDQIDMPVAVYNYLPEAQRIELSVAPGDWFELRGEPRMILEAGANEVLAVYVPIRVTEFGMHELQITAIGSQMSDAVVREVQVLPNGQRQIESVSGWLEGSQTVTTPVPTGAIPNTERVTVKIYPGAVSEVLGGLEGLLQMPYGCFEQTSSVLYPDILVLDYLRRSGQANPGVEMKAEHLIGLGYQRLVGFEVKGEPGGFSLYGDPPADPRLTAYGLMVLGDMAEVAYVDPALLERVVGYLQEQQQRDGSWQPIVSPGLGDPSSESLWLGATAYVAWGMADAGYADSRSVRQAVRYLEQSWSRLDQPYTDLSNYTLAVMANALLAGGGDAMPVIEVLAARAKLHEDGAFWPLSEETYLGAYGHPADIEVTGIATQAMLRSGSEPDLVRKALAYLIAQRDPNGSFYTSQATVQALKALLAAAEPDTAAEDVTVTVTYVRTDGVEATQEIVVEASNSDVVQQIVLQEPSPGREIRLRVEGERNLQYQVVGEYYLPWEATTVSGAVQSPMRISMHYDRNNVQTGELLGVEAQVELLGGNAAGTLIVEAGLPPGFTPMTEDLEALVESGNIQRYELTPRSILLYVTDVRADEVYTFRYRLQAQYPLEVQVPGSRAYDYYAPDQGASTPPQRVIVTLGTP
jgi:uncharacterized protein YfaS (alpha-2-macroglobulin family)